MSLLIKHAFLPLSPLLSSPHLHHIVIDYPPFTIQVPRPLRELFKQKYQSNLTKMSDCKEIVAEERLTYKDDLNFVIMVRGTLEACQKLVSLLVPFISDDKNLSMKESKKVKKEGMNMLLYDCLNFQCSP